MMPVLCFSAKRLLLSFLVLLATGMAVCAQKTDTFEVYTYQVPEFFTRSVLPARVQLTLHNNDTSNCQIMLYRVRPAQKVSSIDLRTQWNEYVVKRLSKASKQPLQVKEGATVDGWASTVAIGNYYTGKKKSVVILNMLRKDQRTAVTVMALSDRIFQGPIDLFSSHLHLLP